MRLNFTIALTLLCGVVSAQTTYPIVDTNQEQFYNNTTSIKKPAKGDAFYGQDAHHEGNKPSYTDNGDGTITDNVTKLMWQKEFVVIGYDEAMELAKQSFAGYSDWRVPTIKEAYSLILFSGVDASNRDMNSVPQGAVPFIDTKYFAFAYGANGTRAIDSQLLSATISQSSLSGRQKMLFGVNLADGRIKSYPLITRGAAKTYMVRLVRGAEYGVNKFQDNNDGTISDLATTLMWAKDDSGKGLNWESALEYAAKMNNKKHLGHDDWRVPNAKELQSIIDYTRSPEGTSSAAIDPMFNISKIKNEGGVEDYPFFWSSTTHTSVNVRQNGGAAAYLCFGRGLGNMTQMGGQQGAQQGRQGQQGQRMGQGQQRQGGQAMQQRQGNSGSSATNWINIHGAGSQRSDPKSGDASLYATGKGPQGDAIRINNYVRLVRDL